MHVKTFGQEAKLSLDW